jgi:hypothetical protein
MFRYLKAAFLLGFPIPGLGELPVNVLGVVGVGVLGAAFPPAWLLGLGCEALYLFGLASNPRFQKYVDAQAAKATRIEGAELAKSAVERLLGALPTQSVKRFEQLRFRCTELRQIAQELHDPQQAPATPALDEMQLSGLDRLLWIYLKLLFTENALDRFLHKTTAELIQRDIQTIEARLKNPSRDIDERQQAKIRKALEDNLATSRDRLANFQKAQGNFELVKLELERLENKIRALSEVAVNRQEPDYISGQVDAAATSMAQTEKTIGDLQSITGLTFVDEQVPQMLERATVTQ